MRAEVSWYDKKEKRHTIDADFQAWPRNGEFIEIHGLWLRVGSVTHHLTTNFLENRVCIACDVQ